MLARVVASPYTLGAFHRRLPCLTAAVALLSCLSICHGGVINTSDTFNLNGNNTYADSFDSGDPLYSVNGFYPYGQPSRIRENGDIVSVAGIVDAVGFGNLTVRGSILSAAPTNAIFLGVRGSVGDCNWVLSGTTGIQPGHYSADLKMVFPAVEYPDTAIWKEPNHSDMTISNVHYQYVIDEPGDYYIPYPGLTDSLYITAPTNQLVRIRMDYSTSLGGTEVIRIADTRVKVQIYTAGPWFTLSGASYIDNMSGHADDFCLFGLPNCQRINFANAVFYGVVYAPQADFSLGGGGNDWWDLIGAIATRTVRMAGHYRFHFDEYLLRTGPCPPEITSQPADHTLLLGQPAAFSVSAVGPSLTYQWQFNGTNLPGATTNSFPLANTTTQHAGAYSVIVANAWGIQTSRSAALSFYQPPTITREPVPQTVSKGSDVEFQVEAYGEPPLRHQWLLNGVWLTNFNSNVLRITNVQPAQAGEYGVIITNIAGSVTSQVARLTVLVPPVITTQPQDLANLTTFSLSFPTELGPTYLLEWSDNLREDSWRGLTNMVGTGFPITITDNRVTNGARFYRLRLQ